MQTLLVGWAVLAALCDWRRQRLPNWLTLGALGAGVAWIAAGGDLPPGGAPLDHAIGFVAALLALLPAYALRCVGAGDVKLFAAMGFLGGTAVLLPTLLIAGFAGGAGALVVLAREGRRRGRRMPFGIGLALGFIVALGAA